MVSLPFVGLLTSTEQLLPIFLQVPRKGFALLLYFRFLPSASLKLLIRLPIPMLPCCILLIRASSSALCVTLSSSRSLKLLPILGLPSLPDLYLGLSFSSCARCFGLRGPRCRVVAPAFPAAGGCWAELADDSEDSGGGALTLVLLEAEACGAACCRLGEPRRVAAGSSLIGGFDAAAANGRYPSPDDSSSSSSASPSESALAMVGFLLRGGRRVTLLRPSVDCCSSESVSEAPS